MNTCVNNATFYGFVLKKHRNFLIIFRKNPRLPPYIPVEGVIHFCEEQK
jgi:hypothetical protein